MEVPVQNSPTLEAAGHDSIIRRWVARLAVVALFVCALVILRDLLRHYHYHEIAEEMRHIPHARLMWACVFCLLNYIVLTFYDTLANLYVGKDLPYRRTALTAFISYTFSQNLGFALLSGGAVRYRLYTAWGFSSSDVAKVIAFTGLNFWLGLFSLVGIACFLDPHMMLNVGHLHGVVSSYLIGTACLGAVLVYLLGCMRGSGNVTLWGFELPMPSLPLASAALLVACVDWLLAATTLYSLLPSSVAFLDFASAYFVAQALGVVSHVPGGLGVFEAIMLMLFASAASGRLLVGALILYRLIYYVIPFLFGAAAFLLYELRRQGFGAKLRQVNAPFEALLKGIVPPLISIAVFVAGCVLLISGATPAMHERVSLLSVFIPLPLLELSHFMGSVIGLLLLFLAWSIQKRIRQAYMVTLAALLAGALASVFKGGDFEEAVWMIGTLFLLLPCRRYFYRKAALTSGFSWVTFGVILTTLATVTWVGLFSFKHVAYDNDLWWRFTFEGDAPRFLRASLGVSLLVACAGLWWLLRPARALQDLLPSIYDLEIAKKLLPQSSMSLACLALVGDKALLFNSEKTAFLMYRRSGRSFIALGDPIGNEDERKELIWQFRDLCDRSDSYCVFYQIPIESLPMYLDLGLLPHKLGEEAVVHLSEFTLEGGKAKGLRYTVSRIEREGYRFVTHSAQEALALLPQLEGVSDSWLEAKNTREKGFSVGNFNQHYLSQFPIACIEREGKVVAFANIIATHNKSEAAIDLMRYSTDAPDGCMEYLFIKLLLFAKEQSYLTFNLGMAPLSGLEAHRLAPLWNKFGKLLYDRGEYFYNFEGLRQFKEKFHPEWQPRYLVSPGGLALPRVLAAVTTLISGGWRGVFAK